MKKFVFALFCTFGLVGFVMADEFFAQITKVDGNTISFKKGFGGFGGKKGGGEEAKEEKADATADVKVAKGEFDKAGGGGGDKKGAGGKKGGAGGFAMKSGDPIEGGLKNEMFSKIDAEKGVNARITTNEAGKVTEVLVMQFGGGAGGKKAGGGGKKKG